jgi:hypothetical protein
MNMTNDGKFFALGISPRRVVAATALTAAVFAAGCMSSEPEGMPIAGQQGAIDTGTYPNLNVPPQVAAEPLTADEAASLKSRVDGARARQAAGRKGTATTSDPTVLRKVAATHGEDTLKKIETAQP